MGSGALRAAPSHLETKTQPPVVDQKLNFALSMNRRGGDERRRELDTELDVTLALDHRLRCVLVVQVQRVHEDAP